MAASRNTIKTRSTGFGSLRISFHTTMLIDSILRAGRTTNESVVQT